MNNGKKEILIVTDEITDYSRYRSLLEDANIDISHRSSLSEAFSLIRFKDVDLVIIDLDIPKFRTKHVNSIRKFRKRCLVINIVNNIATRALEECVKLECVVIEKPINNESLLFHVKRILFNGESVNIDDIAITDSCLEDTPFCDSDNYAEG